MTHLKMIEKRVTEPFTFLIYSLKNLEWHRKNGVQFFNGPENFHWRWQSLIKRNSFNECDCNGDDIFSEAGECYCLHDLAALILINCSRLHKLYEIYSQAKYFIIKKQNIMAHIICIISQCFGGYVLISKIFWNWIFAHNIFFSAIKQSCNVKNFRFWEIVFSFP